MSLEFPIELRVSRMSFFKVAAMMVPFFLTFLWILLPAELLQSVKWLPEPANELGLTDRIVISIGLAFTGVCILVAIAACFLRYDKRILRIEPGPIVWVRGSMLKSDNWRKGILIDLELARAPGIGILPFSLSAKVLKVTMIEDRFASPISMPIMWAALGVKDRQLVREVLLDQTGHLTETLKGQDECQ